MLIVYFKSQMETIIEASVLSLVVSSDRRLTERFPK
jgi:hypothetical protein